MIRGQKLYLDKERAKIAGVCAGLADYIGKDVQIVRIAWVIATIIWPPIMICAYIFMAWLLDPKPAVAYATSGAYSGPWPADPSAPRRRLIDVAAKIVRHAGQIILKVAAAAMEQLRFAALWTRSSTPPQFAWA